MKYWKHNGAIVTDNGGHPLKCESCPCEREYCQEYYAQLDTCIAEGLDHWTEGVMLHLEQCDDGQAVSYDATYAFGPLFILAWRENGAIHYLDCECVERILPSSFTNPHTMQEEAYPEGYWLPVSHPHACQCFDVRDFMLLNPVFFGILDYQYGSHSLVELSYDEEIIDPQTLEPVITRRTYTQVVSIGPGPSPECGKGYIDYRWLVMVRTKCGGKRLSVAKCIGDGSTSLIDEITDAADIQFSQFNGGYAVLFPTAAQRQMPDWRSWSIPGFHYGVIKDIVSGGLEPSGASLYASSNNPWTSRGENMASIAYDCQGTFLDSYTDPVSFSRHDIYDVFYLTYIPTNMGLLVHSGSADSLAQSASIPGSADSLVACCQTVNVSQLDLPYPADDTSITGDSLGDCGCDSAIAEDE